MNELDEHELNPLDPSGPVPSSRVKLMRRLTFH